jgi:sec-independent protein translocase protein TatB
VLGINGSEFVVLLAVGAVVLGPERLPGYAQQLARMIRELRRMAQSAQEKVREELGPEFDDVDWRALDPRQYDPRRIVREALSESIDLDDPLGLRDKPQSPGGPGSRRPSGRDASELDAADTAGLDPRDAGAAAFDPDAT